MEYKDFSDVISWMHGRVDALDLLMRKSFVTRLYISVIPLKRYAPPHTARGQEIEDPFRYTRSLILHVPPCRHGIAVGLWSKTGLKEDEAMLRAIRPHRPPTDSELEFWDVDHTRDVAFSHGTSSRVRQGRPRLRDGATRDAEPAGPEPVDKVDDEDYYEFRGRW